MRAEMRKKRAGWRPRYGAVFLKNGTGYQIGSMVASRALCLFDEAASIHAVATAQFADSG